MSAIVVARREIAVPDRVRDGGFVAVVSMSGGKDSTATALALREAGIPFRMVFADTGWEHPDTYMHLDHLRERIGPIDVVAWIGATPFEEGQPAALPERSGAYGMVAVARRKAGFPLRKGRWCTDFLKLRPLRAYHDAIESETVSVVGIRAEESAERAAMPAFEDSDQWGGYVWRPILDWRVEDVLAIHHRHGIDVNPLYRRGHNRVGCYPCIMADKEEIRLVAEHAPWRIDEIERLETEFTAERARRNDSGEGDFSHPVATFFMARDGTGGPHTIRRVVEWSRTARGGKQLPLLAPEPSGGCFRWGLCEPPSKPEGGPS